MRMPKRLFDALTSQTHLRRLAVQWGVYDDRSALTNMRHLVELELDSVTSVTTLEPLRVLSSLETLEIGGAWRVQDYSPIGDLVGLRQLCRALRAHDAAGLVSVRDDECCAGECILPRAGGHLLMP